MPVTARGPCQPEAHSGRPCPRWAHALLSEQTWEPENVLSGTCKEIVFPGVGGCFVIVAKKS